MGRASARNARATASHCGFDAATTVAPRRETPAMGRMSRCGGGDAKILRERRLVSVWACSAVFAIASQTLHGVHDRLQPRLVLLDHGPGHDDVRARVGGGPRGLRRPDASA